MANSMFGDSLWAIVVIGGFVVLAAAIGFAMVRNRRTPQQERRTEEATHRLYEEQDKADREADGL